MGIRVKDLISLSQLSITEINEIMALSRKMRKKLEEGNKKGDALRGKSIINLFYENSTRTRSSFELAGKYLGADVINISASSSSVQKGESLKDTGLTIDRLYPDIVVMRHPASGAHDMLARHVKARVINAGDGMHAHPSQGLLDFLTITDEKKDLKGLKVVIVGDVLHSRVARSNINLLNRFGCDIWVCGPATLMPSQVEKLGVTVCSNLDEAIENADVVIMLRIQLERQKAGLFPSVEEYAHFFELTENRVARAKDDVLVLHPGPINRGVEIDPAVADGQLSAINRQVTNGLVVRMALLTLMAEER